MNKALTPYEKDDADSESFTDINSSLQQHRNELSFQDEFDVENPTGPTLIEAFQDQMHRLTQNITSETEISNFDFNHPIIRSSVTPEEDQDALEESNEIGGLHFWAHQIRKAGEHGGDSKIRLMQATRAAIGSGLVFACLILPSSTEKLGAVWVGNIWFHVNLSDSLGACLSNVILFARSTVFTTLISWPVAFTLHILKDGENMLVATMLFPLMIFLLTFLIMTSPQLTSNSLMLIIMYIVVANPISSTMIWWKPFGWVAVYFICLGIALVMNIFPFPNLALHKTSKSLKRLEKDMTMLLLACANYSNNNGTNLKIARQAVSTVEFMHTRIRETVDTLKKGLPATKVELELLRCQGGKLAGKDLAEWVDHTEKLLIPLKQLRSALMQKVLGEESNFLSPQLALAKVKFNDEMSPSRDRMISAMIAAVAVCHVWADPSGHRTVLPNVQMELKAALAECRKAFRTATCKASKNISAIGNQKEHTPLFAHLTRRMTSFHALFAIADSILEYLENHSWENEENTCKSPKDIPYAYVLQLIQDVCEFWKKPWKWNNRDQYRLALKTAVGMFFASLFICVPYLKDIASPYGLWPGITIASVNLSTTGSSFHKSADRLMATLVAAAFAMIVADLFPGHHDLIKIGSLSIFTFVVIYLRTVEHAYMYTYSAISLGCMLFGSVKTDYDIAGYIPKRIELIFIGIIIFTIVELLLFPRSSRKIVETTTLNFVMRTRDFLKKSVETCQRMQQYVIESKKANWNPKDKQNYLVIMFQENHDPFHLNQLAVQQEMLKSLSQKLKNEIDSAIAEPSLGLSLPLHAQSFRGLVVNESSTEIQSQLLCDALNKLANYYQQEGHPVRELSSNWPQVHIEILQEVVDNMDIICQWLESVFVDGRIRAQRGNSVKAVSAASSFRALYDVRLKIMSIWSTSFHTFIDQNGFKGSDPESIMTLGITTTAILELCRHIEKAGKNIEEIAYRFPTFQ